VPRPVAGEGVPPSAIVGALAERGQIRHHAVEWLVERQTGRGWADATT